MAEKNYSKFDPEYDFSDTEYIVIGSGLGGLTTAVFLAKSGKKVAVLERHYVPGGFSHTFKRKDGFEWDVGIHYVGGMQDDSMFLKMSNYLTGGRLKWEDMGEVYDRFLVDNKTYDFVKGADSLKKKFYGYFPGHEAEIDLYFKHVQKASKRSMKFFATKAMPPFLSWTLGSFWRWSFRKYSKQTTWDFLSKITDNKDLKNLFCGQCGDYGLPPKESSFGIHSIIVNHFMDGGYYPVGGAANIHENMVQEITDHGGTVFVRADVEEILTEGKRAVGVKVNGRDIRVKNIVSNVGMRTTFDSLLKGKKLKESQTTFRSIQPSHAHYCLYVGLNKSDVELNLPKHNVWYYDGDDMDGVLQRILSREERELRFAYISFPSAKDSDWIEKHGNTATIQAVGISNMDWFREFEDSDWMKRGDKYEALKKEYEEKMLEILYRLFPQIKGHVAVTEVSSPLSTKHFTNHQSGEIYGLAHTPERYSLNCLHPKTQYKGLYLCGQDIVTVGFGGAVASGIVCATQLLKFEMYRQFKNISKSE